VNTVFLWCNNGIGEFYKNLVTFWGPKLPDFLLAQEVAPRKVQFLGTIKKLASLVPWRQNAKWRKIITESTVPGPKYI